MTTLSSARPAPETATYGGVAKLLHWLIALLVIAQVTVGFVMPDLPRGRPPEGLVSLHLSFGATILILMALRLVWRLVHGAPPSIVTPAWQRQVACTAHTLLYVLLFAVPLAGWTWASAKGWPVALFGMLELPSLGLPPDWPYRRLAASIHRNGTWAIIGLVGAHVAAALYHHFVRRDGVLRRMLP